MPNPNRILWLDLETTGNEPHDVIMEIGCVLTDATPELEELAEIVEVAE